MWLDENRFYLVECENCTTFTITKECRKTFTTAWRTNDRETLMYLESVSRYLRLGADDCDREVTDASWMSFAVEGQHMNDDDSESDEDSE
jgi:hypothetical protein